MRVYFECGCWLLTFPEARDLQPHLEPARYDERYSFQLTERAALSCCKEHDAPYQTYDAIKDKLKFDRVEF